MLHCAVVRFLLKSKSRHQPRVTLLCPNDRVCTAGCAPQTRSLATTDPHSTSSPLPAAFALFSSIQGAHMPSKQPTPCLCQSSSLKLSSCTTLLPTTASSLQRRPVQFALFPPHVPAQIWHLRALAPRQRDRRAGCLPLSGQREADRCRALVVLRCFASCRRLGASCRGGY